MAGPLDVFDYGGGVTTETVLDRNTELLSANLANSANNTLATVLSFDADATSTYYFRFICAFDAAATTTGSRWTVTCSGTTTKLAYTARWPLTETTEYFGYETTESLPAAAQATSLTTGNIVIVEGFVLTNAAGTISIQNASEVTSSAITALAGARLYWEKLS